MFVVASRKLYPIRGQARQRLLRTGQVENIQSNKHHDFDSNFLRKDNVAARRQAQLQIRVRVPVVREPLQDQVRAPNPHPCPHRRTAVPLQLSWMPKTIYPVWGAGASHENAHRYGPAAPLNSLLKISRIHSLLKIGGCFFRRETLWMPHLSKVFCGIGAPPATPQDTRVGGKWSAPFDRFGKRNRIFSFQIAWSLIACSAGLVTPRSSRF